MAIANMKVGARLSLGLVLALLLTVALLGVYNMSTIHAKLQAARGHYNKAAETLGHLPGMA